MRRAARKDTHHTAINAETRKHVRLMMRAVIIGIDPGAETGVAIGSAEDPTLPIDFFTLDFWSAYDKVKKYKCLKAGIVIEVPSGHVIHRSVDSNTQGFGRDRQAANVGSNRREATLLADRFESLGFPVERVRPNRTKWNAEELARNTGITQRTNQHVRDAIRMVYERIR